LNAEPKKKTYLKVCNYLAKKLFLQEDEETRDRLKKTISLMRR